MAPEVELPADLPLPLEQAAQTTSTAHSKQTRRISTPEPSDNAWTASDRTFSDAQNGTGPALQPLTVGPACIWVHRSLLASPFETGLPDTAQAHKPAGNCHLSEQVGPTPENRGSVETILHLHALAVQ